MAWKHSRTRPTELQDELADLELAMSWPLGLMGSPRYTKEMDANLGQMLTDYGRLKDQISDQQIALWRRSRNGG